MQPTQDSLLLFFFTMQLFGAVGCTGGDDYECSTPTGCGPGMICINHHCMMLPDADDDAESDVGMDEVSADDGADGVESPDPARYAGDWNGTMDIHFYDGPGGGLAHLLLSIDVLPDGSFTGEFTDPECADEGCPDHEAVAGVLDAVAETIEFSYVYDCPMDGVEYHYTVEGTLDGYAAAGEFESTDASGTPQTYGTWEAEKN